MNEEISQVQERRKKNTVVLEKLTTREKLLESLYPNGDTRPNSIQDELFQITFLKTFLTMGIDSYIHGPMLTNDGVYIDRFHQSKYETVLKEFKKLQNENMKYVNEKGIELSKSVSTTATNTKKMGDETQDISVTNPSQTRTSEDEEHQSLIDNESKKRLEWNNNKSSYDAYLNYKNAIKERLEFENMLNEDADKSQREDYEEKKEGYEKVSESKKIIEQIKPKTTDQIDSDLDFFEEEEKKILKSNHFKDGQKKQMIEELYSDFDKYSEENPELSGRHM